MTKSSQSHVSARDHLSFGWGATWQHVRRETKQQGILNYAELLSSKALTVSTSGPQHRSQVICSDKLQRHPRVWSTTHPCSHAWNAQG